MICEKHAKKFCKDFTKIENYEEAIADTKNVWDCHHRLELVKTGGVVDATRQELIDWGIYYDRPADELIFLTHSEHASIHMGDRKLSNKTRKKLSDLHKGNKYNLGRKYSEQTKQKISKANKISHAHECKKVSCLETHEVYDSLDEASRQTSIPKVYISRVCNGIRKTAGGYHWTFC